MESDSKSGLILKTISSPVFSQTGIVFSTESFLSIISEPCLALKEMVQNVMREN